AVVTGADPKPVRRLRLFAHALAVDTADTLLGIPEIQLPVLAVPIPEIALFKWERAHGTAALQVYAFDAEGRFVERLPDARGTGRWNRFTLLIFVSFIVTDLDEPPPAPPERSP
ncbi:MAG TPA: hypothetical protein VNN07_12335, partial [Candidatus Tectomicrobia bacterium]|nr:hypothetical protein [Candidatus Tectomicrobia bacterium]